MAHNNTNSENIQYDPLPVTNAQGEITLGYPHSHPDSPTSFVQQAPTQDVSEAPYHDRSPPHSPVPGTPTGGPGTPYSDHEGSLPYGAAQPRFLGAALYDEGGAPYSRDSYMSSASQHHNFPSGNSDYNSIYGLNYNSARNSKQWATSSYRDDPNASGFFGEEQGVPMGPVSKKGKYLEEKRRAYTGKGLSKRTWLLITVGGIIAALIAIIVVLYFTVFHKSGGSGSSSDTGNGSHTASGANPSSTPKVAAVSGGLGSTVTASDGTTFTYNSQFGGSWYWDENDPFNNNAQAQSWVPPLNTSFNYGVDRIRG